MLFTLMVSTPGFFINGLIIFYLNSQIINFTKKIYNQMIKSILFAVVLIGAVLFFLYSVKNFLSYIKLGKSENRLNNIKQRLINTLNIAFLQTKLFRSRLCGFLTLLHLLGFSSSFTCHN